MNTSKTAAAEKRAARKLAADIKRCKMLEAAFAARSPATSITPRAKVEKALKDNCPADMKEWFAKHVEVI